MLSSALPTDRLWAAPFYRRPYEFLLREAATQGDHLWFREPGAKWLVVHQPDDVRDLLGRPAHLIDGGSVKRSLVPWLTEHTLPGLPTGLHVAERDAWDARVHQLRTIDLTDWLERSTARLDALATGDDVTLAAWRHKTVVSLAETLLRRHGDQRRVGGMVGALSEPMRAFSPRLSRWSTLVQLQRSYRRFGSTTAGACRDPRLAQRDFLLYAGIVVNVTAMVRHLFAQVLRASPGVVAKLRDKSDDEGHYCRAVCDESLRCAPNLVFLVRQAKQDQSLRGVDVRRGDVIAACPFLTHHREDVFASPDVFDPSRFAPGAARPAGHYYPFGIGERSCPIGGFSRDIAARLLAGVWSRYDMRLVDDRPNPIAFSKSLLSTTRARRDRVRITRID